MLCNLVAGLLPGTDSMKLHSRLAAFFAANFHGKDLTGQDLSNRIAHPISPFDTVRRLPHQAAESNQGW